MAIEARPRQRFASEVLVVLGKGGLRLILQLVGVRLQLGRLQLDALAGRRDVGETLADLLELLELLLVGEVEGVAGVLDAIEHLVRLRLDDTAQALHHAHASLLVAEPGPWR